MKVLKILAAGAALAVALSGTGYAVWHHSDPEIAKRAVREILTDPTSATFSDVQVCGNDKEGPTIVIGQVNSRNSMGGMTGKKTFVVENVDIAPFAKVESDDAIRNPNIADAFVDARISDTTFKASCSDLYKVALQAVERHAKEDEVDMNSTDDISTLPENLAELDKSLM